MSNLGLYQDMTTAAKAAGGVEPYMRGIKMRHAAIGFVAGIGVMYAAEYVERKVREHRARRA